jgi:hypothetical protein
MLTLASRGLVPNGPIDIRGKYSVPQAPLKISTFVFLNTHRRGYISISN